MADLTYPLPGPGPKTSGGDPYVHGRLRDESDGTFSATERARLEAWDGTQWIKVRVNSKGNVLVDRGNAGAETTVTGTYAASQTDTILLAATSAQTVHVTSVLVGVSGAVSATPGFLVKVGSTMVARHPGLVAGGGVSHSDLDVAGSAGDDITFTCDAPTGGSMDVVVGYWIEE